MPRAGSALAPRGASQRPRSSPPGGDCDHPSQELTLHHVPTPASRIVLQQPVLGAQVPLMTPPIAPQAAFQRLRTRPKRGVTLSASHSADCRAHPQPTPHSGSAASAASPTSASPGAVGTCSTLGIFELAHYLPHKAALANRWRIGDPSDKRDERVRGSLRNSADAPWSASLHRR